MNNTNTSNNTATSGAASAGQSTGNAIKQGIAKIHGAGEAIRGNVNTFADNVTNTSDGRSEATIQRGEDELRTGVHQSTGAGAGVTPKDTTHEKLNRQI